MSTTILYNCQGNHNKFYIVDNSGIEVVVFYGRLIHGLRGYQTHQYPLAKYYDLIDQKRKKGYQEIPTSQFSAEAGGTNALPDEIRRLLFPGLYQQSQQPSSPSQQPAPAASAPTAAAATPAAPPDEDPPDDDGDAPLNQAPLPRSPASSSPWVSKGSMPF